MKHDTAVYDLERNVPVIIWFFFLTSYHIAFIFPSMLLLDCLNLHLEKLGMGWLEWMHSRGRLYLSADNLSCWWPFGLAIYFTTTDT